jgi:hypothetical protein
MVMMPPLGLTVSPTKTTRRRGEERHRCRDLSPAVPTDRVRLAIAALLPLVESSRRGPHEPRATALTRILHDQFSFATARVKPRIPALAAE